MIDNHGRQNSGTSYQTSTPVGLHEELEDLVKTLEHHGEAKQLAVLLQDILTANKKVISNHSFQVVKLQNEVQHLVSHRATDNAKIMELNAELQQVYLALADVKGKLASLTIEAFSKSSTRPIKPRAACAEIRNGNCEQTAGPEPDLLSFSNSAPSMWDIIRDADRDIEALADRLLLEQRPLLIDSLKKMLSIDQHVAQGFSNWKLVHESQGATLIASDSDLADLPIEISSPSEQECTNTFSPQVEFTKETLTLSPSLRKFYRDHLDQKRIKLWSI